MSAGTRAKGTRVFFAAASTTWTAVLAGVTPAGGTYTEVACPMNVSGVKRFDTSEFDASCMSDAAEMPTQRLKPGGFMFRQKQGEVDALEVVKDLADATTEKLWCVLYVDGRAFTIKGVLIPKSEGDAENSITAEVIHEYQVRGTANGLWHKAATS